MGSTRATNVAFTNEEHKKLEKAAKKLDLSKAGVLRIMIDRFIDYAGHIHLTPLSDSPHSSETSSLNQTVGERVEEGSLGTQTTQTVAPVIQTNNDAVIAQTDEHTAPNSNTEMAEAAVPAGPETWGPGRDFPNTPVQAPVLQEEPTNRPVDERPNETPETFSSRIIPRNETYQTEPAKRSFFDRIFKR